MRKYIDKSGNIIDDNIIYKNIIDSFLDKRIDIKFIDEFLEETEKNGNGEKYLSLKDEIGLSLKPNFYWITINTILDIVPMAIEDSLENGNLNILT